ncbi:uncharacterized protein LOC124775562 [Schistocerca piceifrons]|uniref:uncharacterized protein LOC124775562 n=1 Tax=Schistocerca piceifrons TaxID=274613 RepID=UPI001F5EC0E7|nr:uncharacterized protein LOC124775562 [Schistocerca piceifrons]
MKDGWRQWRGGAAFCPLAAGPLPNPPRLGAVAAVVALLIAGQLRLERSRCAGSPLPVSHGAVSVESSGGGSGGRGPVVPVSAPSTSCCGPLPQRPARSSSALPAGRPVATVRRTRQRKTPQLRRSLTAHSFQICTWRPKSEFFSSLISSALKH